MFSRSLSSEWEFWDCSELSQFELQMIPRYILVVPEMIPRGLAPSPSVRRKSSFFDPLSGKSMIIESYDHMIMRHR